jgi:hypothetical protein
MAALARGFLTPRDLDAFVQQEHRGNRAAAARAKVQSGEACVASAPRAALKYYSDALDLATTAAARGAVHGRAAAACLEIGHFKKCVGHATRALAADENDTLALRHRLAAHEALGAWRRACADARRLGDAESAARAADHGGDQAVAFHAPTEAYATVQLALDEAFTYAPGGATVFLRRGRLSEDIIIRGAYGRAPLLVCGELVAATPRETFLTRPLKVTGACRVRHLALCAGVRATACLELEDCVVAHPDGVGVEATAGLALGRCLVEHCADGVVARGALDVRGTTIRHCANVGLAADGPARVEASTVAACGVAVRGAVEFAGENDIEGLGERR